MSPNSSLTTTTIPTPPPNEALEHNLRQLLQEDSSDQDAGLYHSPNMEHEGYHRHQYSNSYPDNRHSVGLGIQYVR
jgi:hypothetical protein